jgi:transcriptional regulator with XRE-family HTH domain
MVSESPAVARRRLRLALRKLREGRGVTQSQVAEALEWSLSKVNRIESGDVTISNTDLRALLGYLDVGDSTTIERLTDEARAARRRGWWDEPRYREHIGAATLQMMQFESEASAIRCFQPGLVPGLLQTQSYAEAVFDFFDVMDRTARETRIEVRMRRATQVLDRTDPPQYLVLLDESVLLREPGGPGVLAEQLQRLLTAAGQSMIQIRILPLPHAAGAVSSSFTIFDLGDEENAVLYLEQNFEDLVVHATATVRTYRRTFERFWQESNSPEESLQLIRTRLASLVPSR